MEKIIELKNGYIEVLHSQDCNQTIDSQFYNFLARLLIEDKKIHNKK